MVWHTRRWVVCRGMIPMILFLVSSALPAPLHAQLTSSRQVTLLPALTTDADSLLGRTFHEALVRRLRPAGGVVLTEPALASRRADGMGLSGILASASGMAAYSDRTGTAFLVGTTVRRDASGEVDVAVAVFGQDGSGLRAVGYEHFVDEAAARAGADRLVDRLAHPRNFSPSDTSFFYSFLFPGTGQAILGRWDHCVAALSLVAGAALYLTGTPAADQFTISHSDYVDWYDNAAQIQRHFVMGTEVTPEEYGEAYSAAQTRARRAVVSRRERVARLRKGRTLLVVAWVLNLADTLYLSNRPVDGTPFFQLVEEISGAATLPRGGAAPGLRFVIPVDGRRRRR